MITPRTEISGERRLVAGIIPPPVVKSTARACGCRGAATRIACAAIMYYQRARLRFECTGCGACCIGRAGHVVELNRAEEESIRTALGVSRGWFRRRYLVRDTDGHAGIRLEANGRCPFLGPDMRCRVYAARPTQCRTYPLWPELVERERDWDEEARRCEGMNRGAVVPLARITRALARERGKKN